MLHSSINYSNVLFSKHLQHYVYDCKRNPPCQCGMRQQMRWLDVSYSHADCILLQSVETFSILMMIQWYDNLLMKQIPDTLKFNFSHGIHETWDKKKKNLFYPQMVNEAICNNMLKPLGNISYIWHFLRAFSTTNELNESIETGNMYLLMQTTMGWEIKVNNLFPFKLSHVAKFPCISTEGNTLQV